MQGSGVTISLSIKKYPQKQVNLYFYQGLVKMSVFQPVISTSSLYFGASGPVLNLSSSNSLRIFMSTHGLHAVFQVKNAFPFWVLGTSHLAHVLFGCAASQACACSIWLRSSHLAHVLFAYAAILKPNQMSQECPKQF